MTTRSECDQRALDSHGLTDESQVVLELTRVRGRERGILRYTRVYIVHTGIHISIHWYTSTEWLLSVAYWYGWRV